MRLRYVVFKNETFGEVYISRAKTREEVCNKSHYLFCSLDKKKAYDFAIKTTYELGIYYIQRLEANVEHLKDQFKRLPDNN